MSGVDVDRLVDWRSEVGSSRR